jgi:hypothetical protein
VHTGPVVSGVVEKTSLPTIFGGILSIQLAEWRQVVLLEKSIFQEPPASR